LVPPPLGAAVALTDAVPGALDAVEEPELSDFFSPDEQPDRPAMTIAAPPTATTNPRFTTVLLLFVVTRQDRRIIWVSMGGHPLADMRLGEKFAFAPTVRWLRSTNGPRNEAHSRASTIRSAVWFATMQILRTADEHFTDLAEFPYAPRYCEVSDQDGGTLRMAWVEDGPAHAEPVLMLHGEPSWSFLYRRMMPILAAAGHRVICPDLVGFGRSDKPTRIDDHTYARHVEWMRALAFDVLDLRQVTLVGQDWGGLIGLRLAAEHPDRFAGIVVANTGLPTGDLPMPETWWNFRKAIQGAPRLRVGRFVEAGCRRPMAVDISAGYDAPFPDDSYSAGPRAMPGLVPTTPDDPASESNRAAWKALCDSPTPMLVAFSDSDPITGPMAEIFASQMRGAHGVEHPVITNAGHFLQEDAGEELAEAIVRFLSR
jgi:haloalkane dehalogenase